MKKILISVVSVVVAAALAYWGFGTKKPTKYGGGADIGGGFSTSTNVIYAAYSGHSVDGTNALALLVTETNRAYTAETNLTAKSVAETNRAQLAESVLTTNWVAQMQFETNRAYTAETNLTAKSVTETNRAYTAETNEAALRTAVNVIATNGQTKATNAVERAAALEVGITNIPAASIVAGNFSVDRFTNAIAGVAGTEITNTAVANLAGTQTNTYIFVSVGGKYILKSITTSP